MRILLTNDDGINSEGLQKLATRLRQEHEVWVMAPAEEKSACSHSITLKAPVKIKQHGEQDFACWGSPADCVMIGLLGFIKEEIDFVVSGINCGPNVGTDIIYSGTAAGSRQGALMGKPALAASVYSYEGPFHFEEPAEFITRNLESFHKAWSPDHFLNINFPNQYPRGAEVEVTVPSRRIYNDKLITYEAPDGHVYSFLSGDYPVSRPEENSDYTAVQAGKISLSPVLLEPMNNDEIELYRRLPLWKG